LRLKANTLWPAMHHGTTPFNAMAHNRTLADDHAIVMGSSHAEPMLRNNVGEWQGGAKLHVSAAGTHKLKVYMIDAGVVLDRVAVETAVRAGGQSR